MMHGLWGVGGGGATPGVAGFKGYRHCHRPHTSGSGTRTGCQAQAAKIRGPVWRIEFRMRLNFLKKK